MCRNRIGPMSTAPTFGTGRALRIYHSVTSNFQHHPNTQNAFKFHLEELRRHQKTWNDEAEEESRYLHWRKCHFTINYSLKHERRLSPEGCRFL